ncbi:MAG: hypothetical protein GX786_06105 [Clostridiales bacterium]|nr:hypothetical protein [Clostridiales bacterium]
MQQWAKDRFEKAVNKFRHSAAIAKEQEVIPYRSEGKHWAGPPFDGDGWWTNGFWPALMWQLYAATGEKEFMDEARRVQERLIKEFDVFTHLNHDVGFMYLLSVGADAKITKDPKSVVHTHHAANILAGRFNPAGFIRAWNGEDRTGWAIIDCMMNLPLLYWAHEETGDPRFSHIADLHADTTIKYFVREDGSCNHIVVFDADTGEMLDAPGGQGYGEGSSWSRGQSWALYGFTLSYMATGDKTYLDTALQIADYFTAHIRPDGLTDSDFVQPKGEERIDNIAGAIAACAYLELAKITDQQDHYQTAIKLLKGIDEHTADWSQETMGILQKCTASYHDDGAGRHINITYGDYFFVEALAKLIGTDPMLWMHPSPENGNGKIEVSLLNKNSHVLQQENHPTNCHLLLEGEYPQDAKILFSTSKDFLWIQVDPSIEPALVYLPEGRFEYRIPQGKELLAYPPNAFKGPKNLIRAWIPKEEELYRKRNLALNPVDQRGEVTAYPHATANVETREEGVFAARNVIDGYTENTFHGEWPYQSWGIGARTDAWCNLEFGRPVHIDAMALILRADFPHDAYWTKGVVVLSDGAEIAFDLEKTGEPQHIEIGEHIVTWMRLERLIKSEDPSAFPALTQWEVYGTEA